MRVLNEVEIELRTQKFISRIMVDNGRGQLRPERNLMEGEFDYYDIKAIKLNFVKGQQYEMAANLRDREKYDFPEEHAAHEEIYPSLRKKN